MGLELWIPEQARPRRRCAFCRVPFYEGEEVKAARHFQKCAEKHAQALEDRRKRIEAFETLEGRADVEREEYLRKHGHV